MANHTVPVRSALQVLSAADTRARAERLREEAALEARELADPSARIAMHKLLALYEAAARLTADSRFGLGVGARTRLRFFGTFGHLVRNSATLGDAIGRIERYFPLWTDGAALEVDRDKATVALRWRYAGMTIEECRQGCEMVLATMATNLRRLLAPSEWRPREVHFQHAAPRDRDEHARIFGAPVRFGMPTNALILDARGFAAPIADRDPELSDVLVAWAEERLAVTSPALSLTARARQVVARALAAADGRPELAGVAQQMGVGARTLQRRLRDDGLSFRGMVAAVRRELAQQYLADPELRVGQVAYRLGYGHTSELHRAFRDWTGVAPTEWRRRGR